MNKFSKKSIFLNEYYDNDSGIQLNTLLTLIKDHPYHSKILSYFNITPNSDIFIAIPGAQTLFSILTSINQSFIKEDIVSSLQNISFDHSNQFSIVFRNIEAEKLFKDSKKSTIVAQPIHSAQVDFFKNVYDINKYASKLLSLGYKDILDANLDLLKTKKEHKRKYRLLHEIETDLYYLRAIVSEKRYYDYNNNIAFIIALLKLYTEMQNSDIKYELSICEYNQSFISMYFKTTDFKELKGIGYLENTLQISNDELKREALRFSSLCTISFQGKNKEEQKLFIKPKDIKSKVLTITHGTGVNKAFDNLEDFVKSKEIFENLYQEIATITKIKDHGQIVHLVKSKIQNATSEDIKKYKHELLKPLIYNTIKTTTELLETFNKLILLEGLEIDAKEYLRYLIYEALINRK